MSKFPPCVLDWSDPLHWKAGRAGRCVYCGEWTPLVDNGNRPAHKTCVEHAIDVLRARKEQAS